MISSTRTGHPTHLFSGLGMFCSSRSSIFNAGAGNQKQPNGWSMRDGLGQVEKAAEKWC